MCLMCLSYEDSCAHPACVEAASGEARYRGRTTSLYLWFGYGRPLCPQMVAAHEEGCACLATSAEDEAAAECDCGAGR